MIDFVPEPRQVSFLDVFTDRPLAGNGVAVVADADALSDEVMLGFARETRLSETTFVQSASEAGAHYRNRIWTPGEELPFAGHPSLGTAVGIARWRGQTQASLVQQTGAGLQPLEVSREDAQPGAAERWRASMLQAETRFGVELEVDETMGSAGLSGADAHPELPPQIVSTGVAHAIAPLAEAGSLARVSPDYEAIDALLRPHEAVVLYLAWSDPESGRGRARSFSRIRELGEDPATGSAVGPLCAYLHRRAGASAITVEQGEEMGRPSKLEAEMEGELVRVSGSVVPLIDGSVVLPGTFDILPVCMTATRWSSEPGSPG